MLAMSIRHVAARRGESLGCNLYSERKKKDIYKWKIRQRDEGNSEILYDKAGA